MRQAILGRKRFGALLIPVITAALGAAAADSKPDFSGEWKVNISKSEFGPLPALTSQTDKIDHKDPNLKLTVTQMTQQGERTREWSCTTDGKECTDTMGPNSFKSTASWEGHTLAVDSKGTFNDNEVRFTEKWTVSEDGKTLTISRHLSSQIGEADQTVVLEKQ